MLQNLTSSRGSGFRGIVLSPQGIGHPRKAIDCESLCRKQDHSDFNDDEFSGPGDDAERNDEGCCPAGGWLTRNSAMSAPVADNESAAARTLAP